MENRVHDESGCNWNRGSHVDRDVCRGAFPHSRATPTRRGNARTIEGAGVSDELDRQAGTPRRGSAAVTEGTGRKVSAMKYAMADKYHAMRRAYDRVMKISTDNGPHINNMDPKDLTEAFFNQCYHFKDWIKKETGASDVEKYINKTGPLR